MTRKTHTHHARTGMIRALLLAAIAVGAAAQRPVTPLAVPGGDATSNNNNNNLPSNSDVETSLHAHLQNQYSAVGSVEVPPRVSLHGNTSSGPTQVAVGLAVVSLHHIDVLSGIVEMAVWQRL